MEILSSYQLKNPNMPWLQDAACTDSGVDFFPEVGLYSAVKKAVAICETCPVKQECLDFAMENKIEYGIWGGKTPANRSTLRRYKYRHVRDGRVYVPSSVKHNDGK